MFKIRLGFCSVLYIDRVISMNGFGLLNSVRFIFSLHLIIIYTI